MLEYLYKWMKIGEILAKTSKIEKLSSETLQYIEYIYKWIYIQMLEYLYKGMKMEEILAKTSKN